ncbi:MAG: hypothetical protein ACKOT0_10515, partial [bacterium]
MSVLGGVGEAALFGAIGQSALIVGALLVWKFPKLTQPFYVGALMAFGAGAVISAVGTDLVAVAYDEAGAGPTALGIGIGCLGYFIVVLLLERSSERAAEREAGEANDAAGASSAANFGTPVVEAAEAGIEGHPKGATKTEARNLFVGMIIDGIPESVAIGLTLHTAAVGVSAALVGSVFIAGLPEAMGISAALLAGGLTLGKILFRFSWVVLIGAVSAAIGYAALYQASNETQAMIQAIAAGALLVVVVNEMIPIAVRGVKRWAGVIAAAGFVFSAGLTWATGGCPARVPAAVRYRPVRRGGEGGWRMTSFPVPGSAAPAAAREPASRVLDAADISRVIGRISHEILERTRGPADIVLLGIQTRGVPLAQRLARRIGEIEGIDIPVGALDITMYRDDIRLRGPRPLEPTEIPVTGLDD